MNHRQCEERLVELAYGELSRRDAAAVEAHLAGCEPCRAARDRVEATLGAVRRLGAPSSGAAAAERAAGAAGALGADAAASSLRAAPATCATAPAAPPATGAAPGRADRDAVILAAARAAAARRDEERPLAGLGRFAFRIGLATALAVLVAGVSLKLLGLRGTTGPDEVAFGPERRASGPGPLPAAPPDAAREGSPATAGSRRAEETRRSGLADSPPHMGGAAAAGSASDAEARRQRGTPEASAAAAEAPGAGGDARRTGASTAAGIGRERRAAPGTEAPSSGAPQLEAGAPGRAAAEPAPREHALRERAPERGERGSRSPSGAAAAAAPPAATRSGAGGEEPRGADVGGGPGVASDAVASAPAPRRAAALAPPDASGRTAGPSGAAAAGVGEAVVAPRDPVAREVERRHAAGELSEAVRRFAPCPGGDLRRTAWIDGEQRIRKLVHERAGGTTVEEWFDEDGRLREAVARGRTAAGSWERRVVVDGARGEAVEAAGAVPDAPPPALVRDDPGAAFFGAAGCEPGGGR